MKMDKSKYIRRFCDEACEHLKKINDGLLQLEREPGDAETMNLIFRSAHTIKGSGRMIGLIKISEVAHKMEDVLEAVKKGGLKLSQYHFSLLFSALDVLGGVITQVQVNMNDNDFDNEPICNSLASILKGGEPPKPPAPVKKTPAETADTNVQRLVPVAVAGPIPTQIAPVQQQEPTPSATTAPQKQSPTKTDETLRISASKLDETIKIMSEIISSQSRLREYVNTIESAIKGLKRSIDGMPQSLGGNGDGSGEYEEKLSSLTVSLNGLRQFGSDYKNDIAYQSILTDQLMEKVARLRMLPISTVLDTFHRFARDIAVSLGKKIDLKITGGETELDKKIIENIGDPLMHMIRNCIDHGLESAETRIKYGKSEIGSVTIAAGYEGGSVFIHIADDGGGIPLDKIRQKAIDKRIHTPEALAQLPESEIINLIFRPGFSTSNFITDISGRGVGMDVVKQNVIEKLKGTIVVSTDAGKGTSFHITLPLTLAMMRVFLVSSGDMVFGIMVSSVEEVIKLGKDDVINVVDKKAIRLREQLVPLVELRYLLGLPGRSLDSKTEFNVVVLISSGEKLAVVVDSMVNEEDMEIKPLPSHLRRVQLVSGVALTGKNEIAIILNTPRLFHASKNLGESYSSGSPHESARQINILVIDDSVNTREIEKSILESYGYKVNVAADGMEAFEKAQSFKYDLIVTDVEMPILDGFSLTEKLRKDDNYKHTPIIIVSSRDRDEDKRKGVQVGANAYIVKGSFDQSNLLDTVQSLLDVPLPF